MFISFLYMFRAAMCLSSGEITIFMRHLVFVTLCCWPVCTVYPAYQAVIHNMKYQVSHIYSYFSWWWAHSCQKHVEKRNKHTKKNCAPSWLYLQHPTLIVLSLSNVQIYNHCLNLWWPVTFPETKDSSHPEKSNISQYLPSLAYILPLH